MRLIARFAQEQEAFFEIITVYDNRIIKERLNKQNPILISIAKDFPAAVWFERKIFDDFGINILYSNDDRHLVKHEHFPSDVFPLRKNYAKRTTRQEKRLAESANSDSIILGPVHPYHLESSQFQIFEKNENILHFEMKSFFKYRAIEKMVEGLSLSEARHIVERISAPQTIAYQIAFLEIERQASKRILPNVLRKRHLFLLEYERIMNHLNNLSILSQLLEFKEAIYLFSNFLEEGRELLNRLTGHRFGFASISFENNFSDMDESYAFLVDLENELMTFTKWISRKEECLATLQSIGVLEQKIAEKYGLVGTVARASGVAVDARQKESLYEKNSFYIDFEEEGDVYARYTLKIGEILSSLSFMKNFMHSNVPPFFMSTVEDGEYYSYVESATGEVMMYIALKDGLINRFFLRDPSFLNAQVLPHLVRGSSVDSLGLIVESMALNISAIDM